MAPQSNRSAGDRVGPFEIVRYLASGGMGDVYVARNATTGEPIALKFLADSTPASRERFEREGRIAATLTHPHIVAGRGLGRADDGAVYLAMELLQGEDLDSRETTRGITPAELLTVGAQVCEALESAHARRIVHRDLKPQNVFLCDGPGILAKVLDFGVARLIDERRVTGTGTLVGSWSYMSPEQARAEPDIDARSDLWSLGVLLYEGLSGRLPFVAPTGPGTLYQILFESPPDLATLRPDLPREVVDLVHRALAKAREARFASARAMRTALAAASSSALPDVRRIVRADEALAFSATVLADDAASLSAPEAFSGDAVDAVEAEHRLTSVVFLRALRDDVLLSDVARELQGRVVTLPGDDVLVVFGIDRWNGDEPDRAVRLASAVAPWARGVGVATGRTLRGSAHVTGAAVDLAVALSRREGVGVDATTRAIVRGYVFEIQPDGSARFDPAAQRPRLELADVGSEATFVGREVELAALLDATRAVTEDQQPGGVVVVGAAGMGKSRLRHEAMSVLLHGGEPLTLLASRCEAFRRDTPFAALVDALGDVVDASVARVFAAVAVGTGDPVAALDRARASLESVLRSLAERGPIVLAIDDVQWLDAASQSAVRWMLENATDLPLSVWLFGRPEARDAAAATLPRASVLELRPLARAAAAALLRSVVGVAPDALLDRAAGLPLFLEELARLVRERGDGTLDTAALPPSVEGAHLAQLDQLEPADREFLKRASVFGRSAWLEAVGSLGGDPSAFERLRRGNLVVARPRSRFEPAREFAFRNGVLQEVAYGLWTDAQRARLHDRAAGWLSAQRGAAPDELARHWELAGDRPRAAEAYTAAAEASAHVSDTATTRAHAERALELSTEPALRWRALVARDDAMQLAGDRVVQRLGLEMLADQAQVLGTRYRAEAAWRFAYLARMTGDRAHALAAGESAIELAMASRTPRWAAAAHNELALLYADESQLPAALHHASAARSLANELGDEWSLARAIGTEAYVASEADDGHALELFELSAARYARAGDRRREALALANAGALLVERGRLAEARTRIEGAIDASRRVGNARTVAVSVHNLGVIARIERHLVDATRCQSQAGDEAARLGHARLALGVAIETLYIALESDAPLADRTTLADAVQQRLEGLAAPQLAAEAHAARARALGRAGRSVDDDVTRLRELLPVLSTDLMRADALAAVWEFGGRAAIDATAARAAFARHLARVGPEDRAGCAEAQLRRMLAPVGLFDPSSP